MRKRLHDTDVWEKPWFRKLNPTEKLAFLFILDKCDPVGVWDADAEMAELYIGGKVDWEKLGKACNGNLRELPNGKVWVVDFCVFQYKRINPKSPVHRRWLELMERQGLLNAIQEHSPGLLPNPLSTPLLTVLQPPCQPLEEEEEAEEEVYSLSLSSGVREDSSGDIGEGPTPSKPLPEKIRYDFEESLWYGITDEQVQLWGEAYPAVDVDLELRQMGEWCKASGARGRKNNWRAFITNWLKRQQDKGGSVQPGQQKGGYRR
jgi:hypothetical protein